MLQKAAAISKNELPQVGIPRVVLHRFVLGYRIFELHFSRLVMMRFYPPAINAQLHYYIGV
jgi:hypothetical protein